MSVASRLGQIAMELEQAGLPHLVMGGHAVRHYGLERHTNDFDLQLAPEAWPELENRLQTTRLFSSNPIIEGPSWRPAHFRRFQIGTLPNGGEEWLEFWQSNHLLSPFAESYTRCEVAEYGGSEVHFLSLSDLIRSKETERDKDWDDVAVLEEFYDSRLLRAVTGGQMPITNALAQLRSRRGLEAFAQRGFLNDPADVANAIQSASMATTQALLVPYAPHAELSDLPMAMKSVVLSRLRSVHAGTPLHFALCEVVRRQYRHVRQSADRADKERLRP